MQDPIKSPDELTCPYTGHKKLCKKHRDHCGKWMKMTRTDPRTGTAVDEWLCNDTWNTILMTEIIQRLDGVQGATESFRNEMVNRNDAFLQLGVERLRLASQAGPPSIPNAMEVINDESHDSP